MNDTNEIKERMKFYHEIIERALGEDGFNPHLVFSADYCGAAGGHFTTYGLMDLNRDTLNNLCGLPVQLQCKAANTFGDDTVKLNVDVTFKSAVEQWPKELQEKVPALQPLYSALQGLYAIRGRLMTFEGPALAEKLLTLINEPDVLKQIAAELAPEKK
jgi:predicted component of type VI protein secretion system